MTTYEMGLPLFSKYWNPQALRGVYLLSDRGRSALSESFVLSFDFIWSFAPESMFYTYVFMPFTFGTWQRHYFQYKYNFVMTVSKLKKNKNNQLFKKINSA